MRATWLLVSVVGWFVTPRVASAEPVLVSIEGQAALPLTTPQTDLFGAGAALALALRYPLAPELQLGVELRAGFLADGPLPADLGVEDPGLGSFELGMLVLRVRPLARFDGSGPRRAAGLFVDVGGGGGVTGKDARAGFQLGLGYALVLGAGFSVAPTARYLQVIQPSGTLSPDDARLALLGVELSAFDVPGRMPRRPAQPRAAVASQAVASPRATARQPDRSLVSDEDADGIDDIADACPSAPEDRDQFEDADGCPDPDNDRDQFPDTIDTCPDRAEVVNGNEDGDGCPDVGLIVLENDRIVLEERVVFDFERTRVKHRAQAVLKAIVRLKQQHPEWIELRVEGHADAQGSARFNQEISERRARNVVKALVKFGIAAEQIEALGFGSTRLRDAGTSEQAHQRNRRVEIVVMARRSRAEPGPDSAHDPWGPQTPERSLEQKR